MTNYCNPYAGLFPATILNKLTKHEVYEYCSGIKGRLLSYSILNGNNEFHNDYDSAYVEFFPGSTKIKKQQFYINGNLNSPSEGHFSSISYFANGDIKCEEFHKDGKLHCEEQYARRYRETFVDSFIYQYFLDGIQYMSLEKMCAELHVRSHVGKSNDSLDGKYFIADGKKYKLSLINE